MRRATRILLVPTWAIVALPLAYLAVNAQAALLARWYGRPADSPELLALHAAVTVFAGAWMFFYGVKRAGGYHPATNKQYRAWLEQSPWNSRLPLPLGPATLAWKDALLLGLVLSCIVLDLSSLPWIRPFLIVVAAYVLVAFVVGYALGALASLGSCRQWRELLILLVLLPLVPLSVTHPMLLLLLSAVMLAMATVGIKRSLARFPWPQKQPDPPVSVLGWPFDKLGPSRASGVPRGRGLLAGAIVGWWFFCIAQVRHNLSGDVDYLAVAAICGVVGVILALGRVLRYCASYRSPIGLITRLRLGVLLIPRYDYVLLAPLATVAAATAVPGLLQALHVAPPLGLGVSMALIFAAVLELGPTFDRWRLTGAHRMPALASRAPAHTVMDDG
jgi:hypothetical protein